MKPTGIVIQARMGSRRLPGKALADLAGRPLFQHVVERLRLAETCDEIVVATTHLSEDDPLVELCDRLQVPWYRGSPDDVLSRFVGAAQMRGLHTVVRATGDNPLVVPTLVDAAVRLHRARSADYTHNSRAARRVPEGLDVEVVERMILEDLASRALTAEEREHVTLYIYHHPAAFRIVQLEPEPILRRPDLRLTVDTPEDLRRMRRLFAALYRPGLGVPIEHALAFAEREGLVVGS